MKHFRKKASLIVAICIGSMGTAQNAKDTTSQDKKYSAGFLPAIAFDSDLGFQYGILANLYKYTSDYKYPYYAHSLYVEASRYTAGSTLLRVFLDSKKFVGPIRVNFDCTYIRDLTNDFIGFNGKEAIYNSNFEDENSQYYQSRMFYKFDSQMLRIMVNLKGTIHQTKWQWVAGLSLFNFNLKEVDIAKLNKRNKDNPLPDVDGLFKKYIDWGLIAPNEKDGGFNTQIKAGIGYDSRTNESNPDKGIWSEVLLSTLPPFLSSHPDGNIQMTAVHRQYLSLIENKTIFAYRLQYHQTLLGKTPFYLLSNIPTSWLTGAYSEGLGGAKTLRGIRRNRLIGKGFALANVELRQRLVTFKWKRQDFYLTTNIFTDCGTITQKYPIDLSQIPIEDVSMYFNNKEETLHFSSGIGLKFAMNENFIVSADYGRAYQKQDGESGLYINLNYLF